MVLDLSVGSSLVDGDPARNAEPHLGRRVQQALDEAGARIGVGRYDEARYLYTSPAFATGDGPTDETRTVHLGIDLFAPPGTPVHAPLDGIVAAFADNAAPQDYGPVIVLAHRAGSRPFFTLYGHLSRESLDGLEVGRRVAKGERIAAVGSSEVNGGWAPHLHFQVIDDLLGLGCGFPGVASPSQREVWTALCPDPNLILGIPAGCFPPPEPGKAETLATRRDRLGTQPERRVSRAGEGRARLDAVAVRRAGPAVPGRVQQRRARRPLPPAGGGRDPAAGGGAQHQHPLPARLREPLRRAAGRTLPEPLSVCFFVNSASEANELALRLARAHTGQRDMIVLEAAYHGHTTGLIDISPYKHDGPGGRGAPEWVHTVPIADPYRGPYRHDDPQAGEKYAAHVTAVMREMQAQGRGLAGFIAESLPSVGGQIVFPPGYLAAAYANVRAAGGVCIADEVQTGFGRLGTHFWGFETQGVVPDIVVLGKPIGNGHPLGAVVTTPADRRLVRQRHGVLHDVRGQPGLVRGRDGRARRDRGGRAAGARPAGGRAHAGRPAPARGPPPAGRRRARLGAVPGRRAGARPHHARAGPGGGGVRRQPPARAPASSWAPTGRSTTSSRSAPRCRSTRPTRTSWCPRSSRCWESWSERSAATRRRLSLRESSSSTTWTWCWAGRSLRCGAHGRDGPKDVLPFLTPGAPVSTRERDQDQVQVQVQVQVVERRPLTGCFSSTASR